MIPNPTFQDSYTGQLGSPGASPRDLFLWGERNMPGWIGAAMWVRNALVRPFGLVTRVEGAAAGEFLSGLPVYRDDDVAFETGLDDRHLDFRLCLTKTGNGGFELATRLRTHNRLGRIYLAIVMPAHRSIMRSVARGLAQPIKEDTR